LVDAEGESRAALEIRGAGVRAPSLRSTSAHNAPILILAPIVGAARNLDARDDLVIEHMFDILGLVRAGRHRPVGVGRRRGQAAWASEGGRRVRERFVLRETDYGYGVWDLLVDDWWIPRLDMARQDAQLIVDELNEGSA
jgi:hypothetical protein